MAESEQPPKVESEPKKRTRQAKDPELKALLRQVEKQSKQLEHLQTSIKDLKKRLSALERSSKKSSK